MAQPDETDGEIGKPLDAAAFREAMSRIGTAVHVAATDGPAGRVAATVSAFASVTDSPPTILVCINRKTRLNAGIRANGVFTVNTLPAHAQAISDAFAGRNPMTMDERFATTDWRVGETGAPIMVEARVALDCQVGEILESGSHSVIFASVVGAYIGDQESALIYLDRSYHRL
ncbi:flavin reductase [Stappia sp. F7233]|uniref:Flavin reductase n=2 Tax=Stappia albiluteola TaxID=2758565 RepID=A0A839AEX6_9HYPH|nr:flavin reductase [Stappia albiluteola]